MLPTRPDTLRHCAAVRYLPYTCPHSTRCRRCSTRDPIPGRADAASAHARPCRWLRSVRSAAPPDASFRCRPPTDPSSGLPSRTGCCAPTASASPDLSNSDPQADARFASCGSSCSCAYNRSSEMLPFSKESVQGFFRTEREHFGYFGGYSTFNSSSITLVQGLGGFHPVVRRAIPFETGKWTKWRNPT